MIENRMRWIVRVIGTGHLFVNTRAEARTLVKALWAIGYDARYERTGLR